MSKSDKSDTPFQLMPELPTWEFDALKESIRQHGVIIPIPASPNKFATQIKILIATEVIDKESYRAKARPTGYRLRPEARRLIDEARLKSDMP